MRFSSSCLLALGLFKKKIPQETVIKNKDNKISQSLDIFNIWVRVKTHSAPSGTTLQQLPMPPQSHCQQGR
jgi:hypothetical protein